ncbi:MAG: hypothetical protein HYX60_04065 [Legionella longbeachae]|nr:hypothetical protein [Legionella longbeachae]
MKGILGFAITALLATTVNANTVQDNTNDAHVSANQHITHHGDVQQAQLHQQKHKEEIISAHLHDHLGNVNQANQHVKDHNGSQVAAHNHDHQYDEASADAHSHDHGVS